MKPCRTALQQDVLTKERNLIYGVRLQVNVGDGLAKSFFSVLLHCSEKNKKMIRVRWTLPRR